VSKILKLIQTSRTGGFGKIIRRVRFMLENMSEKSWEELDQLLNRYRGTKGSVIPVLQQAQEIFGYLPKDVLIKISKEIDVPISQVFGVVTFYSQFHLEPRGKNIIRSCQGTACHVRGAKAVLNAIREDLGLKDGQVTTPDLQFTLETVACIGACGLAPCLMINDDTHGRLTAEAVGPMLAKYHKK
jgi:NADH-quinone oxidoreductase subunit E